MWWSLKQLSSTSQPPGRLQWLTQCLCSWSRLDGAVLGEVRPRGRRLSVRPQSDFSWLDFESRDALLPLLAGTVPTESWSSRRKPGSSRAVGLASKAAADPVEVLCVVLLSSPRAALCPCWTLCNLMKNTPP